MRMRLLTGKEYLPQGANCTQCTLADFPVVPAEGPMEAPLVICGEAPGTTEIRTGRPFTGRSGKLLRKAFSEVGLNYESFYITNVCLCAPDPVRPPAQKEIKCCKPRLLQELAERQAKVVLALGNSALKALTDYNGITQWRGAVIQPLLYPQWQVIPTYHPAAILRAPRLYQSFIADLHKLKEIINNSFSNTVLLPEVTVSTIETVPQLTKFIKAQLQAGPGQPLAVDIETASDDSLLTVGLAWSAQDAAVITDTAIVDPIAKVALNTLLQDVCLIGHNLKFDLQVLWRNELQGRTGKDSMLQHYMLNEIPGTHSLKYLAREYLGMAEYEADLKDYYKKGLENCPKDYLIQCNGRHAAYSFILSQMLEKQLDEAQKHILNTLLYPASDALARMEMQGIAIDVALLQELDTDYKQVIAETGKEMYLLAGKTFNPNSPKQLLKLFYEDLDLPVCGKMSTDKLALETLKEAHPIIPLLQKYRQYSKLHSTFIKGLAAALTTDNKVHTTFNLHGTVTGRLSSSNPLNLQNIPRESAIRNLFIPTKGRIMLEGDLSQAEVRALAWYSKDRNLIDNILSGEDLHIRTAVLMFKLVPDAVTPDLRNAAKRLTFGVLYGLSAEQLAVELKITVTEAEDLITRFFAAYKQVQEWIAYTEDFALKNGYVKSAFGRVRRFGVIDHKTVGEVKRQAVNAPIQAMASDITLQALIRLDTLWQKRQDVSLLLTVHDSILTEADPACVDEIASTMLEVMSAPVLDNRVPFTANVKIGKAWGGLSAYSPQK